MKGEAGTPVGVESRLRDVPDRRAMQKLSLVQLPKDICNLRCCDG